MNTDTLLLLGMAVGGYMLLRQSGRTDKANPFTFGLGGGSAGGSLFQPGDLGGLGSILANDIDPTTDEDIGVAPTTPAVNLNPGSAIDLVQAAVLGAQTTLAKAVTPVTTVIEAQPAKNIAADPIILRTLDNDPVAPLTAPALVTRSRSSSSDSGTGRFFDTFGITAQPKTAAPSLGPAATVPNIGVAARAGFIVESRQGGRSTITVGPDTSPQTIGELARGGFVVQGRNPNPTDSPTRVAKETEQKETQRTLSIREALGNAYKSGSDIRTQLNKDRRRFSFS